MMLRSAHLPLDYKLQYGDARDWVDDACQRCGKDTVHVHEDVTPDERRWRHIQHL